MDEGLGGGMDDSAFRLRVTFVQTTTQRTEQSEKKKN